MLSDEERKAIETIKDFKNLKWYEHAFDNGTEVLDEEQKQDIDTILNLIEKQSKEIEELKEECKEVVCVPAGTCFMLEPKDVNKKWKDKIKAKIEYYEKIDNPVGKRVLQSLLEKE